MANGIEKYGALWDGDLDALQIELGCIRAGGRWRNGEGKVCGLGLFQHYRNAQTLCWPEEDHHRWSDLILSEILKNTITAILGPKDSGKTHGASKFGLIDYFAFADETLILASSTDLRGLEMRVWGDIKSLHERARNLFEWLPGYVLESKHAICTDEIEDGQARDMRKGIICIPCMSSTGQFVGLGKYLGIKQKRRRLIGDESQLMRDAFLQSIANLNSGDFKGVFLGNPIGQGDPLDKISEPRDGWDSIPEPEKTTTWDNRFLNGRTINLVGTDSPNFDQPQNPPKYSYMINQASIDAVVSFYGKDSLQYHSQCKGTRKAGLNARRVITRELCQKTKAFEDVIWRGAGNTKLCALDAAYGSIGGDRCVIIDGEFGLAVDGGIILAVSHWELVPVTIKKNSRPEDQIADFVKAYCEERGIPPENFGWDATGRGSLGTAIARVWSANVEPIEFGGKASERPVSLDLYVWDPKISKKRLKLCSEHYSKFVTELWFSARYAMESLQVRRLPVAVAEDGYAREWKLVSGQAGERIEIESKTETKERMGRSPDLFDAFVTLVELARRRGLNIKKVGNQEEDYDRLAWFREMQQKSAAMRARHSLNFGA